VPSNELGSQLAVALIFLLLTPSVVFIAFWNSPERPKGEGPPVARLLIATASFVLWIAAIPLGPLQAAFGYEDWLRALLLVGGTIIFTLLIPGPKVVS
jgi:hypothetical protein